MRYPTIDGVDFAAALRREREAAGLSVYELARRAGVGRSYLGKVEAGRAVPRLDVALRLADTLGRDLRMWQKKT
jgi:transcriptional regulator with XRE-family HTH domain